MGQEACIDGGAHGLSQSLRSRPMMVVHPDGTWYGGVDEAAVDRIVAEHIVDGEVVQAYACTPGARQRTKPSFESG